jgi:hypothetical protein
MIGSLLDVPICAIENFLGDLFGQVLNVLDNDLGGLFGQLNNLHGGGILLPSEVFAKGIQIANLITNVLECDGIVCPVEPTAFSNKYGVQKKIEDRIGGIMEKASLNKQINPLLDKIDNAIDAEPSAPNCNTNVLRCGPPKVDFIGGGGRGVTGSAIVNTLGRIIGVSLGGVGSGFTSPPLLTFVDSCGNGSSAGGYPRINDKGEVVDVVITDPGSGFLPNTVETTQDENGVLTVKEIIPDPNGNYDGETSYVTELDDVVVQNAGVNYDDNDTVVVQNAGVNYDDNDTVIVDGAEVELVVQNGHIIDANVVNGGFGFTDLPDLQINSKKGVGAKLLPVLKFTKVDDAKSKAEITQDAVVTVISCIQK